MTRKLKYSDPLREGREKHTGSCQGGYGKHVKERGGGG